MGNREFDKAMKSKLQNLEQAPKAGGFAAIQERLKEPAPEKAAFVWPPLLKYGLAASLAFMLGLATMNILDNDNSNSVANNTDELTPIETLINIELPVTESNQEEIIEANAIVANESNDNTLENDLFVASNATQKINVIPSKLKTAKTYDIDNSASEGSLQIFSEEQGKVVINVAGVYAAKQIENQENLEVYALYGLENELEEEKIEIAKVVKDPAVSRFEKQTTKTGYTGFWFGPKVSGNHQILSSKNVFGLGLGFDFGYDFKPNFGFQSGLQYNTMMKEVSAFSEQGLLYTDVMDYSHFNIPFAFKWKKSYLASNIKRPVSFNAYLGGDYARLTKLNKNQLGAHLGLEYDIFLKPEMMFTVGIKTGLYSILDYTPQEHYLQDSYRKFNYAMSIYTSLRFISPKKRK